MHATITPHRKEEEDRLMDLEEVAEKLGNISTRSVRRLIARGDLPKPVKVLSSPRLYHSDIVTYLERLKQKRDTDKQSTRTKENL
jgi:predicted DNA-binding transcriptional regulator AlpA